MTLMNILLQSYFKVLVLVIFCFIYHPIFAENTFFFEPVNEVNFSYDPSIWKLYEEKKEDFELLRLSHNETVAEFRLFSYVYQEPISIEEFISRRIGQSYDGWTNLGQRASKMHELIQANVDAGFLTIQVKNYAANEDDVQKSAQLLVIEYYYVYQEKKGVVLSFKVQKNEWPKIKDQVNTLVKSFWIGKDKRPEKISDTQEYPDEWRMVGQGVKNHQSIKKEIVLKNSFLVNWKRDFPYKNGAKTQPLVLKKNFFLSTKNGIEKRNTDNGSLFWENKELCCLDSDMAYMRQAVYFYAKENQRESTSFLASISSHSGKTRFKVPLQDGVFGSPVVFGNGVFSVSEDKLVSYSLLDGKKQWSYQSENSILFEPLFDKQQLFLVEQDHIRSINWKTGQLIWAYPVKNSYLRPIILDDSILIFKKMTESVMEIVSLDKDKKTVLWSNILVLEDIESVYKVAYSAHRVLVLSYKNNEAILRVLDEKTGEMLWKKQFQELPSGGISLVYENVLFYGYIHQISKELNLAYVDLDTGEMKLLDINFDINNISSLSWIMPSDRSIIFQLEKHRDFLVTALNINYKK